MYSNELFDILRVICKGLAVQFDVLACDQLLSYKIKSYPCIIVANTDPTTKPGNHWTLFYLEHKRDAVEYYDSYGLGVEASSKEFLKFVKRHGTGLVQNIQQLQAYGSSVCGAYCLFIAYHRLNGMSPCEIYDMFRAHDYKNNDAIVDEFVKKYKYVTPVSFKRSKCLFKSKLQCCTKF